MNYIKNNLDFSVYNKIYFFFFSFYSLINNFGMDFKRMKTP